MCSGETAYYVGDKDIIAAVARRTAGCKALPSNVFFSMEPYAVAVSRARPDLLVQLQGAIYRLFSDGTVRAISCRSGRRRGPRSMPGCGFETRMAIRPSSTTGAAGPCRDPVLRMSWHAIWRPPRNGHRALRRNA